MSGRHRAHHLVEVARQLLKTGVVMVPSRHRERLDQAGDVSTWQRTGIGERVRDP